MSDSLQVPRNVACGETIARIILNRTLVSDGMVSPLAFNLRPLNPPEKYVSVFRQDYIEMSVDAIKTAVPAWEKRDIYGYVSLGVKDCRSVKYDEFKIEVKAYPSEINPAHAGILFLLFPDIIPLKTGDPIPVNYMEALQDLAAISVFSTLTPGKIENGR